ncbi:hypothetical protein H072_10045 [Dactylellina haptotyla CBS 200.50]|uniref:CFEM domain-containing protein n=1 Tax=Dactylellina haptotyla (strain CBS 200.50) TaxID=1284197 RepID=S8A0D9_DACHA|nr:hypothetical protein H072_10045 [Dactylellina haptotyla CBS 200.50]
MKTTSIITAITTLAVSTVSAQSLVAPPSCAIQCIMQLAPSSGCSNTDYACFCRSEVFATKFNGCVTSTCGNKDFLPTKTAVEALCGIGGVTVTLNLGSNTTTSFNSTTGTNSTNISSTGSPTPDKNASSRKAEISFAALGTSLVLGAVMLSI